MIQIAELLFAMSLSGTFAFLIYFAASRLLSSRFSAGMRYFCLKVCMLFFLIPFPAVKHLLLSSAKPYVSNFVRETPILYDKNAIIQTTTGFRFPFLTFPVKLFLLIWGALLFAFFCHNLWCFFRFRCQFGHDAIKNGHSLSAHRQNYLNLLSKLQLEFDLSFPIRLYECDAVISPFTCGYLHPAVFLTALIDDTSAELAMRHELQHIRNRDFLFRTIAALLLVVHCLNPFAYLFFRELMQVQELNCDACVLSQLSSAERRKYGHMIIDFSSQMQASCPKAIFFSETDSGFLKKRIQAIAVWPKRKSRLLPVLVLLLCLAGAIPIAAYHPYTIDWRGNEMIANSKSDLPFNSVTYTDMPDYDPELLEDELAFHNSDDYLITADGEIICDPKSAGNADDCRHVYESGIWKTHEKIQSGCIVTTYTVSYCSSCHFISRKDRSGTCQYEPCFH